MSLLEVNNINVFYGMIHAVKDVSFKVEEGEVVSLIGANGAGKTTTLETVSGINRSKGGSILFQGEDISKTAAHSIVRQGIAQVPEGRRVFSSLSVRDNLVLGGFASEENREHQRDRVEKIFHTFPILEERQEQKAGTLSGGEQQMLAIGRALMSNPKLLILDEPSMGLSPLYVKEVFGVIKKLHDLGVTILLVEQNAKMALAASDRVYVLETGSLTAQGSAEEMQGNEGIRRAYLGA